jgi:hypothetical protein
MADETHLCESLGHVKDTKLDLVCITWCCWVVEHIKAVQVRCLAIEKWLIAEPEGPEPKIAVFNELQVL